MRVFAKQKLGKQPKAATQNAAFLKGALRTKNKKLKLQNEMHVARKLFAGSVPREKIKTESANTHSSKAARFFFFFILFSYKMSIPIFGKCD